MTTTVSWAVLIPDIIYLLLFSALAIFVVTRPSDGTSAKTYALWALGMLGTQAVTSSIDLVFMVFEAQQNPYTDVSSVISGMSILSHLLSAFALCLLVAAAVTGRSTRPTPPAPSFGVPADNHNPYQPPSS